MTILGFFSFLFFSSFGPLEATTKLKELANIGVPCRVLLGSESVINRSCVERESSYMLSLCVSLCEPEVSASSETSI